MNHGAPVGQKDRSACAKKLCVAGVSKERQHAQWLGHRELRFDESRSRESRGREVSRRFGLVGFPSTLPSSRAWVRAEKVSSALSPLRERVDRTGVFFSRGGSGEGAPIREQNDCYGATPKQA